MRLGGNDYTRRELGGAFGGLGTLVPFLAGYIPITGVDPATDRATTDQGADS